MANERSRIVRYADLRRKIENMSYFSLDEEKKQAPITEYKSDPDPSKAPKPSNPQVRHNTLTVPLDQLLKENGVENTMEFKAIDEAPINSKKEAVVFKGRQVGDRKKSRLPKDWWIWALVGGACLILAGVIIALSIVFAGK